MLRVRSHGVCPPVSCARGPSRARAAILAASAVLFALVTLEPFHAAAQERTRVLFISSSNVPARLRSTLQQLIASRFVLASTEDYERAAARADLHPASERALRRVATRQN